MMMMNGLWWRLWSGRLILFCCDEIKRKESNKSLVREGAVEYMNCGKSVFSRVTHHHHHHRHHHNHHHDHCKVARVCKTDVGGTRSLNAKWTSFLKARRHHLTIIITSISIIIIITIINNIIIITIGSNIVIIISIIDTTHLHHEIININGQARLNCSVPGNYPFYFDEIQDISELVSISKANPDQKHSSSQDTMCRWAELMGTRRRRCCTGFSTRLPTQSGARRSARSGSPTSAPPLRVSSRSRGTLETTGWQWILTGCPPQGQVIVIFS